MNHQHRDYTDSIFPTHLPMTAVTNKVAQEPLTIAVIGGGIGGISLSIGLLHRGINVQIYEAAPAFKEIGAGVTLGPNSIRAMHLIDPAIKAAFDRLATKNHTEEEAETWMNVRRGIGEGDLVLKINTTDAEKTGLSSVHRTQFLNELVKLIPHSAANLGRKLVNLHPGAGPNGKVRLEFEDGGVAEADAVIGCDGVRSRVRQILLGKESEIQDLNFTGKYAYRGLVPMEKAQRVLGDYFARNGHMYIGPGSYVFHYPIDHGRLVNVIAVQTKENGKWEHERWVQSATTEEVKEAFRPWRTSVRNILAVRYEHLRTHAWRLQS
jgi:salicylate hydroxylase